MTRVLRSMAAWLAAAVLPLAAAEATLRIAGYESPLDWYFLGFEDGDAPVFEVLDGEVRTAGPWREVIRAEPFPARRSSGERRWIAVGDSVVWGHRSNVDPAPLKAWPDVLQERLRARPGGHADRVVNCAARTWASGRVAWMLDHALALRPDVVIASFGSSEFLEQATRRAHEARLPSWLRRLRMARWLEARMLGSGIDAGAAGLGTEELRARDPALNASFVSAASVPTDEQRTRVLDDAGRCLERMASACRACGVRLVLMTVPSNLRWPPFATRWPEGDDARARGERAVIDAGNLLAQGRAEEARAMVEPLAREMARSASLRYRLAQALDALEDATALDEYRAARDEDGFPLRAVGAFNERVREVARTMPGVILVDVERLLEAAMDDGIPDDRLFLDQNHLTEAAHRGVAEAVLAALSVDGGGAR